MWIVAHCYNGYRTPETFRVAFNTESEEFYVDPGGESLFEDDWFGLDLKRPKGQQEVHWRDEPERWMELLPQAFHGIHAGCSLERTETFSEAILTEHPGHGSQKVHGRRFAGIAKATIENEGYSANWIGHQPKSGYMVGGIVTATVVANVADVDRKQLGDLIKGFVHEHRSDLRQPGRYLGTWVDEGAVYLDVSQRVATKAGAMRLGRERKELAIYDVRRGTSVDVPGEE